MPPLGIYLLLAILGKVLIVYTLYIVDKEITDVYVVNEKKCRKLRWCNEKEGQNSW